MKTLSNESAYKNHIQREWGRNKESGSGRERGGKNEFNVTGEFNDPSDSNNPQAIRNRGRVDYHRPDKHTGAEEVKRVVELKRDAKRKRGVPSQRDADNQGSTSDSSSKGGVEGSVIGHKIKAPRKPDRAAVTRAGHQPSTRPVAKTLRSIDKLILDLELESIELEDVVEQLKSLVSGGQVRRITNQSKFWRFVFFLKFDDHFKSRFTKDVGVAFQCQSICDTVKTKMQVVLNPALMDKQQVEQFMYVWKTIFPVRYRQMVSRCRVYRLDEAIDVDVTLDDLIVELDSSQVSARYYTKTDRRGRIETMYTGGIESEHHGVAYDQDAANGHKTEAGHAVPLNAATADHTFVSRAGNTRIESRRIFKKEPLTIAQLLILPSAMDAYSVLDLTRLRPRDCDSGFIGYLDCIRLRGIRGARLHMLAQCKQSKEVKQLVADYERRLSCTGAEWWSALDHNQQLGVLMKAAPMWRFLRHAR